MLVEASSTNAKRSPCRGRPSIDDAVALFVSDVSRDNEVAEEEARAENAGLASPVPFGSSGREIVGVGKGQDSGLQSEASSTPPVNSWRLAAEK